MDVYQEVLVIENFPSSDQTDPQNQNPPMGRARSREHSPPISDSYRPLSPYGRHRASSPSKERQPISSFLRDWYHNYKLPAALRVQYPTHADLSWQ
jgi:hypothetical protein